MGIEVRTLQFRVLGPLGASRDGKPVRLGGDRQRALLALLLVHANELVSMEQLVDQLFGGEPSGGATNAVYAAISRLRRTLESDDGGVLSTRPGGYVLELDDEQLDAALFERLRDEGRELLAAGEPSTAAARLREALALWRGPVLADLALLEFVQPEVRRLEELRVLAVMERIDADLALGRDAELIPELESLVVADPLRERLRAQLMLALYRSGRQAEALAVYREASEVLREGLGLGPGRALQELERMMLQQDAGLDPAPAGPVAPTAPGQPDVCEPVVCPFKGLAFFDRSDARYFCGRERVVSDLVARLAEWPLVGILGPSGIGKSSLLRAGLLPALRAGALPGSGGWRQVLLRPGEHPCDELSRAFGGGGLEGTLSKLTHGERIVIAVDQLEELFTVCEREQERSAFLGQLVAAAHDHERRAVVVCALRADFYGRLSSYQGFAQLLTQSHVLVGPMDREELTQAIEQPASRAGLEIEHALVDALVSDVVDEPGGLPLLSTALLELWLARDGRTLRFQSYRTTGGVRGAVSRLAEAAYSQLSKRDRTVALSVLLRLAGEEDGALVRRRVGVAELERIDGAARVLTALTDARLLTVSDGEVELSHEALLREWPRYLGWLEEDRVGRRLHAHLTAASGEWDARGRDPGDLYRGARLTAALDWVGQHRGQLNRLEREFIDASRTDSDREARRQRTQNRRLRALLMGTGILLLFSLLAGIVAVVKQQSATNDARLAAAEARAALGRQLAAEAGSEPRIDVAMLLAREAVSLDLSPQTEGTLLSTLLRSPAVIGTFALPTNSAPQLAISPDGGTLAVSDSDANEVRFYDARTRSVQRPPLGDFVGNQPPAYSSDGSLLVYPAGGFLAVRDAHNMALLAKLPLATLFTQEETDEIPGASILVAPDRSMVYYAYWVIDAAGHPAGAYIDRWSLPSGRRLPTIRIGTGALFAFRLIDAGTRLIVVGTRQVSLYDARSLRLINSVGISPALRSPSAAAISPAGRRVVIGSQNGSVSFVDVATGDAERGAGGQGAAVAGVVYSPDGRTVVTFGDNNQVTVWDPDSSTAPVTQLSGPLGQVQNAVISPSGTTLYTASLDGVMLAWDLTGSQRFGNRERLGPSVPCCDSVSPRGPPLALSPDGTEFAARVGTSTVGLFSTQTLERLASLAIRPAGDVITALAWSPTGSEVAVAGHSGLLQLWDVTGTPRLLRSLVGLRPLTGVPEAIQAVAFSPDGTLVAASDDTETSSTQDTATLPFADVAVWQSDTGALVASRDLGEGNGPGGSDVLGFSQNGKLLAVSLLHGGVLVLDATTGQLRRTLSDRGDDTISLAFAPDGTLATGTLAGTVYLWNPKTGARLAPPLLAASAPITSIAFDPTGQRFATTGYQDGTVKLWSTATLQQEGPELATDHRATSTAAFEPVGTGLIATDDAGDALTWPTSLAAWEQHACAVAARNLSREEWARFVPELPYATVCP